MDLLAGASLAVGTLVVLVVALGIVGFVVLFRRRGDRSVTGGGLAELNRTAGTLLVRLDDDVRDAEAEVGFALAQFGTESAQPFVAALNRARADLAEAFRLRQALDDAIPDTPREQREWTLQIIALCERAERELGEQERTFRRRRSEEGSAASTLEGIRRSIREQQSRLGGAHALADEVHTRYATRAAAGIRQLVDRADSLLRDAEHTTDAAAATISQSRVTAVAPDLAEAARQVRDAAERLDAVERRAAELAEARAALEERRASAAADVDEARAEVDRAPEPESARAILEAIDAVLAVAPSDPADPVDDLERLGDALARLDLALAASRNEADRRAHARAAYEGTLVSARSQISVARELVANGRVGVDARTRLAEAERQLVIAQAETDPVEALDAIRRAVTHARDADALARYNTMG
ncbi:chromosome segregation ATPase [Microbacteriaceae bacterium SG_E_30_P1]|uniref:Chromosome segregation ATPase n=1 Tax=Antiquaquibacter oligotrophicus TaxID=2880260 RepID=A0ABT6KLY8_9MICO|nr:hypothetical protein [Antiquaquibacter oligotrophicus]MDH6180189.1 chromosome segregation ATPase [Antiquaquibacter oligotrophicus]UDF14061.1 hypothetical protein LH407_04170 [Antiquaquibacter oligotrophicus]